MAPTTLQRFLDLPRGFDVYQRLVGAPSSKRRFIEEFVRPAPGERVLDIGCGTGALCSYMPDGVSYLGVDVDEAYVEAARARYGDRGEFVCSDIASFRPRGGDEFDAAIAYGVLHHLDDSQAGIALDVARSALKSSGRFVAAEPVFTPGQGRFEALLMRNDRGKFVRTEGAYAELAGARFARVDTRLVGGTYRVPYTLVVLDCRA